MQQAHDTLEQRVAERTAELQDLMVTLGEEITERKRTGKELKNRLLFETFIADLSARFVNLPAGKVNKEIEKGLKHFIEFLGVDRGAFGEFLEDGTKLIFTYAYATS